MNAACIITVAITGSRPRKRHNIAVPISVSEQIESTHASFDAGASVVDLHVRNDDETPSSDPARFSRVLEGIHQHCPDMVTLVSATGSSFDAGHFVEVLKLGPDMASFTTGSSNLSTCVHGNAPALVEQLAVQMAAHGVKPAIQVFDLSMIFKAVSMQHGGQIKGPLHMQFLFGAALALPADREVLLHYVKTLRRLAPDATWTGAGSGRDQLELARWSLELGGHCRTGLGDNIRLHRHGLAPSNAALVKQIECLCMEYGRRPATGPEARRLLSLPPLSASIPAAHDRLTSSKGARNPARENG
jgi:3-keto-5-aminohexanoate cleavage enzyme